ncbi:50S ribosomal protein L17 [candidate division WOR-3 bacterium]|nr:50S ribosomal protein L17 [candidate division WOR-3 bacterium]
MRHRKKLNKLGKPAYHRRSMLSNLARSVFAHYGIVTTLPKAKETSKYASKLITFAKKGDLSARREVMKHLPDKKVVHKLFNDIAPRFKDRTGGYTRITHLPPRKGDGAKLALLELIGFEDERKQKQEELKARRKEREEKELKGMERPT